MRSLRRTMMIAAVVAVVLLGIAVVVLALQVDDWSRDLTTNHAATSQDADDAALRPIHMSLPVDEAGPLVAEAAATLRGWSLADFREDSGTRTYHFVRTSRLLRFKDDITVRIEPTPAGAVIHAESRSRVGKGDLGQNPRNLRELLLAIEASRG